MCQVLAQSGEYSTEQNRTFKNGAFAVFSGWFQRLELKLSSAKTTDLCHYALLKKLSEKCAFAVLVIKPRPPAG